MSAIQKGADLVRKVAYVAVYVSSGILLLMCLLVVADALGRYFFNKPIQGTNEVSEIMMPYVVFLVFGYVLLLDKHIRMTILVSRLSRWGKLASEVFANVLGLCLTSCATFWAWKQFWESFLIKENFIAIPLPMWLAKLIMPIGMFILALCFLLNLVQRRKPAPEEKERVALLE